MDEEYYNENINNIYYKINSQATDDNNINSYNFNKIYKKFLFSYSYNKSKNLEINKKEIWYKIFTLNLKLMVDTNLNYKTFFLDKGKKIKHIDNYRIIMISPIAIKWYEEYNYIRIEKFLQNKIDKKTNNKQFGFKKKSSTYIAIENIKNFKIKGIKIFIDLYRAYELTNRKTVKEYLIKKLEKYKKIIEINNDRYIKIKLNKEKLKKNKFEILENNDIFNLKEYNILIIKKRIISINIILGWLKLIDNSLIKMNNKYIKTDKGIPMGSKWSPIIYNFFISIILKDFIKKFKKDLEISLYADDLLLNIKKEKIYEILNEYIKIANEYNIIINFKKSEILINNKLNINDFNLVLEVKEKYNFLIKNNCRYLGKWIKIDENNNILSGNDEYKNLGSTIYLKNLTWDINYEYSILYYIGKLRYNFVNEFNINKQKEILKKWRKYIVAIRNIKSFSYYELLNFINIFKIYIFNIYNKNKIEKRNITYLDFLKIYFKNYIILLDNNKKKNKNKYFEENKKILEYINNIDIKKDDKNNLIIDNKNKFDLDENINNILKDNMKLDKKEKLNYELKKINLIIENIDNNINNIYWLYNNKFFKKLEILDMILNNKYKNNINLIYILKIFNYILGNIYNTENYKRFIEKIFLNDIIINITENNNEQLINNLQNKLNEINNKTNIIKKDILMIENDDNIEEKIENFENEKKIINNYKLNKNNLLKINKEKLQEIEEINEEIKNNKIEKDDINKEKEIIKLNKNKNNILKEINKNFNLIKIWKKKIKSFKININKINNLQIYNEKLKKLYELIKEYNIKEELINQNTYENANLIIKDKINNKDNEQIIIQKNFNVNIKYIKIFIKIINLIVLDNNKIMELKLNKLKEQIKINFAKINLKNKIDLKLKEQNEIKDKKKNILTKTMKINKRNKKIKFKEKTKNKNEKKDEEEAKKGKIFSIQFN